MTHAGYLASRTSPAIPVTTTLSTNGNGYTFTDTDGTEYQLVWRADSPWLFAFRPLDGEWSTATVADAFPRVGSANAAKRLAEDFANNTGHFDQGARTARIEAERNRQMREAGM